MTDFENAQIRSELIKIFEPWYFKHNNEADENMCYIRIDPTAGFSIKTAQAIRSTSPKKQSEHFLSLLIRC